MPQTKATNFRLDERTSQLIEDLKIKGGAATKAEVIRKALALLFVVSEAKESGQKVLISNQEGSEQREIIFY